MKLLKLLDNLKWKLTNIYDVFRYAIPYFSRNLYNYRKILWNDRDWDSGFLLEIMSFKLKRMSNCLNTGQLENGKTYAEQCKEVAEAIDRLIYDFYFEEEYVAIDKKAEERFKAMHGKTPTFRELFKFGHSKEEKKALNNYFKKADKARKQDEEFVFETIKKYYQYWWD